MFEFVETTPDSDDTPGSGGIAVLAGGCYDNLVESLGGTPTACIGWAAGVDRLGLLREESADTSATIAVRSLFSGSGRVETDC